MLSSLLMLLTPLAVAAHPGQGCAPYVSNAPEWMSCRVEKTKRGGRIMLQGGSGWAGKPVINRMRVKLRGDVSDVTIDRGMLAQLTVIGTKGSDRITLGGQAGTISKRFTSRIRLGNDNAKDVFTFTNTTQSHGPFNHAQRIVVSDFGREDVIKLANVGRTIRYGDIQKDGSIPGVPRLAIRVEKLP